MIEWINTNSWPFYVNSQCTVIGNLYIDRSKTSNRMFRLRYHRSDKPADCRVVRIERGTLDYGSGFLTADQIRPHLNDLRELAKLFLLKPRGVQKTILGPRSDVFVTRLDPGPIT